MVAVNLKIVSDILIICGRGGGYLLEHRQLIGGIFTEENDTFPASNCWLLIDPQEVVGPCVSLPNLRWNVEGPNPVQVVSTIVKVIIFFKVLPTQIPPWKYFKAIIVTFGNCSYYYST